MFALFLGADRYEAFSLLYSVCLSLVCLVGASVYTYLRLNFNSNNVNVPPDIERQNHVLLFLFVSIPIIAGLSFIWWSLLITLPDLHYIDKTYFFPLPLNLLVELFKFENALIQKDCFVAQKDSYKQPCLVFQVYCVRHPALSVFAPKSGCKALAYDFSSFLTNKIW